MKRLCAKHPDCCGGDGHESKCDLRPEIRQRLADFLERKRAGKPVKVSLSRPEAVALLAVFRLMTPLAPFQKPGDPLPSAVRALERALD